MRIPTNPSPLLDYLSLAPLPLAFERTLEAQIFADLQFDRPVLDIGCGEGLFAKVVFEEPVDTGVDPNSRELERARDLGSHEELIECFGHEIPKPDGAYNTIFSNSVLEHIPDLDPVLREAHRLLAPGGRMYLTVPSDKFEHYAVGGRVLDGLGWAKMSQRYRESYNSFWRHYHCHSPEEWADVARRGGFEVVDRYTYNPRGICLINDLLVPLSAPGLAIKKITNRWTLVPALRRVYTYPIYLAMRNLLERGTRAKDGGLVFLSLRKAE